MGLIDQIASLPLFQGLSKDQLGNLSVIVVDQAVKRGEIIFSEGDEGNGLYFVLSGRVKVFKISPEGKEQILHIFGPGDPFGEAAVFEGERFPAHAQALEQTRLFFFPRKAFIQLISRDPSLALKMLAELSFKLRHFAHMIEDLSLKEVPGRLAAYLLFLSHKTKGENRLNLEISKNQLASLLGTIPETLSRILGRMERDKLIRTEGKKIEISNRSGLEDLADGATRLP